MKIRIFCKSLHLGLGFIKITNQQKLNIHRYENLEFQTVYEKEIVSDL